MNAANEIDRDKVHEEFFSPIIFPRYCFQGTFRGTLQCCGNNGQVTHAAAGGSSFRAVPQPFNPTRRDSFTAGIKEDLGPVRPRALKLN